MTSIVLTVAAEFGRYSGAHPETSSNGTIFTPTPLQLCISRTRFFDAADWRLRLWLHRRQVRPQEFNDDLRATDVRRLARHRSVADIRDGWDGGTGSAASSANAAGSVGR